MNTSGDMTLEDQMIELGRAFFARMHSGIDSLDATKLWPAEDCGKNTPDQIMKFETSIGISWKDSENTVMQQHYGQFLLTIMNAPTMFSKHLCAMNLLSAIAVRFSECRLGITPILGFLQFYGGRPRLRIIELVPQRRRMAPADPEVVYLTVQTGHTKQENMVTFSDEIPWGPIFKQIWKALEPNLKM